MIYGSNDYSELYEVIKYRFKDSSHLDKAFTHKSFTNECRDVHAPSYERYEFLGDAILQFVSSSELFHRYPDLTEGELSRLRSSLVCEYSLSEISKSLGFGNYLYLSKGEEITGGRNRSSLLCDLFESVLGAIYLDGGIEPAKAYVNRFLLNDINKHALFYDSKSKLQIYAQKNNLTLEYKLIREEGPDHNKTYQVQVVLGGIDYEMGSAHTLKGADQVAAASTLIKLQEKGRI